MSKIWFYVSHRPVIVSKRAYLFKSQNYNEINRYGIIITMEWSSFLSKFYDISRLSIILMSMTFNNLYSYCAVLTLFSTRSLDGRENNFLRSLRKQYMSPTCTFLHIESCGENSVNHFFPNDKPY